MGHNLPDVDLYEGQFPLPPPPPPAPPPPPPQADMGFIESHENWNCTVSAEATFCPTIHVNLASIGSHEVKWKFVMNEGLVSANVTEGVIQPGDSASVALDIIEARLDAVRALTSPPHPPLHRCSTWWPRGPKVGGLARGSL